MIGVIERIKNSVLLKCSTLNDELINNGLEDILNKNVYHFAESLSSLINNVSIVDEEKIRSKSLGLIKNPIEKKIKRKLFIDSLALQITNDAFIEDYVNNKIKLEDIKKGYIKELNNNKNSNQLNMTEDLNLDEIMSKLNKYIEKEIIDKVKENLFLGDAIINLLSEIKENIQKDLKEAIKKIDKKYLDILIDEINEILEEENINVEEEKEGDEIMMETVNEPVINEQIISKFEKYDDMTLFNKMILSLNTKEEKLSRKETKLNNRKEEVDQLLAKANKNIEANIERESELSNKKLELNAKEVDLNSKLSEAEVIFLNIKPLLKGLNKIKENKIDDNGGSNNE